MHGYLCCVGLYLLYIFVVISPGFGYTQYMPRDWLEEHLQNDLFCVEWGVRP